MQPLTRDEFLTAPDAKDVPPKEVKLEGGRCVHVRMVSGTERDAWEEKNSQKKNRLTNIRGRLVALVAVDPQGARLFTEEDAEVLGRKRADVLDVIFQEALRFNGWSKQDVEELEKN